MSKTSISSRIQKNWNGNLRNLPLDGQIQGEVVVGTTVLQRCIEMNLCLRNEFFLMLCDQGIVLGHHICNKGIEVGPTKVSVILNLPKPQTQRMIEVFWVMLDTT